MNVKFSSLRLFYDKTTRGSFLKVLCRLVLNLKQRARSQQYALF